MAPSVHGECWPRGLSVRRREAGAALRPTLPAPTAPAQGTAERLGQAGGKQTSVRAKLPHREEEGTKRHEKEPCRHAGQ